MYRFISTNFRVIRNVALDVFAPDDWMVHAGLEELSDVIGPRINSVKPLFAEHTGKVFLNG